MLELKRRGIYLIDRVIWQVFLAEWRIRSRIVGKPYVTGLRQGSPSSDKNSLGCSF
jgi:hypothetical protein